VELEAYLGEGWTIDDVRRLNEAHGLTVSESGSLMQCHAGAMKVLAAA
jgi:hypothetical protein